MGTQHPETFEFCIGDLPAFCSCLATTTGTIDPKLSLPCVGSCMPLASALMSLSILLDGTLKHERYRPTAMRQEKCNDLRSTESVSGESLLSLHSLLAATPRRERIKSPVFILSIGATSHMTPLGHLLVTPIPLNDSVSMGDSDVKF